MKVSTSAPFQIIYSYLQHEYLGYIIEPYAVQLDANGKLTLKHQHISAKNAAEFASRMDETDKILIQLCDDISQESIVRKYTKGSKGTNKKISHQEFFFRVFNKIKPDPLQSYIISFVEQRVNEMLLLMHDRMFFEMGNDGEPTWKRIHVLTQKATVLFHFMRNEENTHYFPTIKYENEKIDFQYKNAVLLCNHPAWLVVDDKAFTFEKEVDGHKLRPFLRKKFIEIPKKMEEEYYEKFISPLIASFDVHAKGFKINTEQYQPKPLLQFSELAMVGTLNVFAGETTDIEELEETESKIVFGLYFKYGDFVFPSSNHSPCHVKMEKTEDSYIFHKVRRSIEWEQYIINEIKNMGIDLQRGKKDLPKAAAFAWIKKHRNRLIELGFDIKQDSKDDKKYFFGESSINIEVKESNDWFDIHAVIRFGEFEIPFIKIRKYIIKGIREFELPNGEIAIIPEEWFQQYNELFAFVEDEEEESLRLKKHHVSLVQDLKAGNLAKVEISSKLEALKDFDKIEDYSLPSFFNGQLRPYQKAGYNWMRFLASYNLGGCLADDMGLGKTVQTLAIIAHQKEAGATSASLLIMPTSLIYNWQKEASKFTPELKLFNYTGINREKNVEQFSGYDLVITSYGTARRDIEELKNYYFNYIILDESQAIKNPDSNTARAIRQLKSRHKLILTGTPIENSTLDLWSQMNFINPGLLGSEAFFKKEFLTPIEKKHDEEKTKKLHSLIKPFILRRHKSQVATELPEKIENIHYSSMTAAQEQLYEKTKSAYRNEILDSIEHRGVGGSQILLLEGLTKLRQIANHPSMVDDNYEGDSGKLIDVMHMMHTALAKNHKILLFSQFVKHLNILRKQFEDLNLPYAYLDGRTKDREEQVEKFQNNDNIRLFLISLKAGGVGLNLTSADYVFILDPWWNPAIEAQAIDRAYRIGQKNTVFTYKFITQNSVEEKILNLQRHKQKLASDLITTEESFVKNLSKEDIVSIFD
ncbi:MAG: SNF2-related protein [Cytophagaceae bacterium]|nr:SNF2-related protein [Cytophagaceae bacterium]MDW8455309.1 DEAD/DEAH box helicase [Cytophagaceae bacterium]